MLGSPLLALLHSLAIRALVDTLGPGPISIHNAVTPSRAHTRARTLQERLGSYQK